MTTDDIVWAALVAAGIGYEIDAIRRRQYDRTASRTTRRWFRTQHPVGKAVFAVGWLGFASWFAWHIVKEGIVDA